LRVGTFQFYPVPGFFLTLISLQSFIKVWLRRLLLMQHDPKNTLSQVKSEFLQQGITALRDAAASAVPANDIDSLRAEVAALQVTTRPFEYYSVYSSL
jgi:hypothetical protein